MKASVTFMEKIKLKFLIIHQYAPIGFKNQTMICKLCEVCQHNAPKFNLSVNYTH